MVGRSRVEKPKGETGTGAETGCVIERSELVTSAALRSPVGPAPAAIGNSFEEGVVAFSDIPS